MKRYGFLLTILMAFSICTRADDGDDLRAQFLMSQAAMGGQSAYSIAEKAFTPEIPLDVHGMATLKLPADWRYLRKEDAQQFLLLSGMSNADNAEGVIFSPQMGSRQGLSALVGVVARVLGESNGVGMPFIIETVGDDGYVSDSGANHFDKQSLLDRFGRRVQESNTDLGRTYNAVWYAEPHYDPKKHCLSWAIEIKVKEKDSSGKDVDVGSMFMARTSVLGKEGFVSFLYNGGTLLSPEDMNVAWAEMGALANSVAFLPEHAYEEHHFWNSSSSTDLEDLIVPSGPSIFSDLWQWMLKHSRILSVLSLGLMAWGRTHSLGKRNKIEERADFQMNSGSNKSEISPGTLPETYAIDLNDNNQKH